MKHIAWLVASLVFAVSVGRCQLAGPVSISGKVVETMDAGGYTYVLVDSGSNQLWAAATQFPVKKGDTAALSDAMPMTNFHSKSLNRDFPLIYFAGGVTVNGVQPGAASLMPPGHPAVGGNGGGMLPPAHPAVPGATAPAKVSFAGLKPAPGGKTVAEIYASSAKLAGQSVTIRGKVVKSNVNIMGRNWLHLQDGTGGDGSNDLLVTTDATAKNGDTVLVAGKVTVNKDFGAGYKYAVLIEDATVTVE